MRLAHIRAAMRWHCNPCYFNALRPKPGFVNIVAAEVHKRKGPPRFGTRAMWVALFVRQDCPSLASVSGTCCLLDVTNAVERKEPRTASTPEKWVALFVLCNRCDALITQRGAVITLSSVLLARGLWHSGAFTLAVRWRREE